ncbi:MAG: sulfatase-like hydrolase/transferase [Bacteroidota bacterium]
MKIAGKHIWYALAVLFLNLGLLALPAWRGIIDPWVLHGEWCLSCIALVWLGSQRQNLRWALMTLSFLLFLFLQLYQLFSISLYASLPNYYNDWVLLWEVVPIFMAEFHVGKLVQFLPALLGAVIGLGALLWLGKKISRLNIEADWRWTLGLTLALLIGSFWKSGPRVIWNIWPVSYGIQSSLSLSEQLAAEDIDRSYAAFHEIELPQKPDVYLLFIESYGSLLMQSPELRPVYEALLRELELDLYAAGWQMASRHSIAPISGGRSWLSFTSLMMGQKIAWHPYYNRLINDFSDAPHMVRFFNAQGYQTWRMTTLGSNPELDKRIPYDAYERFFAFDHWMRYQDFPYAGPVYSKFGSIPDQFAMYHFAEEMAIDTTQPKFLFFITLNSHSPWYATPPLVQDWRKLNQQHVFDNYSIHEAAVSEGLKFRTYFDAMRYELQLMARFIREKGGENSVFVLVGDHQPPFLTRHTMGMQSPLHLISRDAGLIQFTKEAGFREGLHPGEAQEDDFKHEDFYPFFIQGLQQMNAPDSIDLQHPDQ